MIQELDKKILSLALRDKKFAMELTESTNHKYFQPNTQWLYMALNQYFTDPNIKAIPTRNMIEEYVDGNANASRCLQVYDEIVGFNGDPGEFTWLMDKLRFKYNEKMQHEITNKIKELQKLPTGKKRIEEINQLLKQSVSDIDAIHKKSVYREGSLKDSAAERAKKYNYIEENPESASGVLSGWSSFDKITNGLHPGEFCLFIGDTGGGKSILMHNYAVNAFLGGNDPFALPETWDESKGKNVLFFSLEMPKDVIERRIDSCVAGIYSKHIRDGLLDEEDKRKYFRSLKFQAEYKKHFYIVDMPKNVTARDIELKYIEASEKLGEKIDLVVIDYMGIMKNNDATGSDWQDLGVISSELHEFARIYDVAVLSGSQVNRTKDGAESYNTNRVARSSMIPTNCNVILQIGNRPDEDLRGDMIIYVIKCRDGEKGNFVLIKDFGKMRVMDLVEESFGDDGVDDLI